MTRIIAGVARGRRLAVPASGTRPTSDRVREALFSTVESEWRERGLWWADIVVLDLYAGSGALGLEALSRGAVDAVLVEQARSAIDVLRRNVEAVGLPGARVIPSDVRRLGTITPPAPGAGLVLADPPYDVASAVVARDLARLADVGWIAPGAFVAVERPARRAQGSLRPSDPVSPLPAGWGEPTTRIYGDTALWYGRVPSGGAAEERA